MATEPVHFRISLTSEWNEDKYRDLTVTGPDEGDDRPEVDLGISSLGLHVGVRMAPEKAREVSAALLDAAGGPELATIATNSHGAGQENAEQGIAEWLRRHGFSVEADAVASGAWRQDRVTGRAEEEERERTGR